MASSSLSLLTLVLVVALCALASADMYLHNMRGSNNRLDERNRDRNNGNRLFDSQNNNRGGSNVGSLYFFEGERVPLEWTNQHGCGNDYNDCQIVIQYMCDDRLRDGVTTRTIPDQPSNCLNLDCNNDVRFGMHEDYDYYMNCKYRFRNRGLFTADRNLNGNTARFTRQNQHGNRRGYECPEERDHYPYWHPSPWIDIAVFTNDASRCDFYRQNSENVKGREFCALPDDWYHHMIRRGGNGNNGFIPNTKVLCERLNMPNSAMKQFLQAQAQKFFDRIATEAKDEFQACEDKYAECAELASDPPLHARCLKAFENNITVAELNGAISYCFRSGFIQHPVSDCPVCLSAAACPAETAVVLRNVSLTNNNGCPSADYKVETLNQQFCILSTCAATAYTVDSDDLQRYDDERAAKMKQHSFLIESQENPTCRSRLSLSANCIARSTKSASWKLKDPHNVKFPWLQAPVCRESQWSRPNHLGNGIGGHTNGHNMSIPQHVHEHCAMRIRYNITTGQGDYHSLDAHNAGQVNSTLNRINNNGPAQINVGAEHSIPMTNSDRPFENARGYLFRQNPQVQIFDFERLVQYCADRRATIAGDHTKCNVLSGAGVPTGQKTAAQGVYCPDTHSAGVKYTGDAVVMNGGCAATCLNEGGAETPRKFCQSEAGSSERDFVLQLAINTNQFGRTFQDRTHSYAMRDRDQDLTDRCNAIYALNVRGKRGNIVQTFPGTEYDFTPNRLHVVEGDCVHFQWTGSNTNPNNNDGQGKQGTDRHNLALLEKVRGEGGRGVERAGGKGRNGNTWTTADMEPGWEGFQLNARPTMADRSCDWKRTGAAGERLYKFAHPYEWKKCVLCTKASWTARPFVTNTAGEKTWQDCPAGTSVDFGHFGVSLEWCVQKACIPSNAPAFKNRPLHPSNYISGLDSHDPLFKGFPATQIAVPELLAHGHWGMSHPDHLDNVTRDGFMGLTRGQLQSLATLDTVQFRGEMSELDDAGTYFDMPVHKVSGLGTYYYLCTRNNNFSNRSQKGKVVVSRAPEEQNIVGSTGGIVTMRVEGGFVREANTVKERAETADFSVEVPPMSLAGAVPIELKVTPSSTGVGMPNAASDVLWVGPADLAATKRFPDVQLQPAGTSRRRADDPDITASFRVISKDKIWFRLRSPAFDRIAKENPAVNVISFELTFKSDRTAPMAPFTIELNNGNELEGQWIDVPALYVQTVEAGEMWVVVHSERWFGAGKEFMAQIVTVPNTGTPMLIRMPVSVTLQYGRVYYFRDARCIENYVKGCEFERTLVDATISGGEAVFARGGSQTQPAGGFYQASSGNNLPIIVGVTVACMVLALVAVGSAVYFRKHPSEWESFKDYGPKKYLAIKRSFASQV